ncbi:alpha-galactosidase [Dyadobacter jejuensis]|uniref:Alpha-galactosidase n=1 Tax=Dyadobacter jejuensis TaxID=1082580 RepID=A0A316ADQ0_9BACT|nr:glycoside hydrolase family 27 protein [Dyadobacter jejuensis]PWJ55004.1 alpha-galactosidase [Dyadobacter jejuensis]
MLKTKYWCAVLVLFVSLTAFGQKNAALAPTPPMGWNSWNWFGKNDINEKLIKKIIDTMVKEGLRDAGYNYVIIDGGWRDTKLGPNGELLAHPVKFPHGIKPLADYAHSKGMKLGVHVVPGTHDCAGDAVGGLGREEVHLKQFVEWGLDFIKIDRCQYEVEGCGTCSKNDGWNEQNIKEVYEKWGRLLKNSGRDILYSISAYEYRDWYPATCNMARTTYDIRSRIHKGGVDFVNPLKIKKPHLSVMDIVEENNKAAEHAGNGYWNDPDMMVTGVQGLSDDEQESHFALWCMMSAPLFLGNDPRFMDQLEKELILNKDLIAINQEPTEQGRIIKRAGNTQVWVKKMKDGTRALLFLNLDPTCQQEISIDLKSLGLNKAVKVKDVIGHQELGVFKDKITMKVNIHQSKVMLVTNQE